MNDQAKQGLDIEQMLRQAELQQAQLKLELQFQKNMALFKKYAPQVYAEYVNYRPQQLRINYDDNRVINLVNMNSGRPVYGEDPRSFCQKQLAHYLEEPMFYKVNFNIPAERYFFQLPLVSQILRRFDCFRDLKPSLQKPVGVLVVNGCGLGYHIPALLEQLDVRTLCIFDPHKDSFYASLHTMDWEPVINYCYRRGRLLKLFIGMSDEDTMTSLRIMTNRVGLHNIANTYVYNHLSSDETTGFTRTLYKQFHLTLTGTGFLEDEQVSFAHTCRNLSDNIPVLNNNKLEGELPPAFVIGNGPSLDGLLPLLRKYRDRAVLFSCGSTTATLYKEGIQPDFHVEMERIGGTTKRIESGCSQEYRDGIRLLALNTVAPKTMNLFAKKFMAKKLNDPGEFIIDSEFGAKMPFLNACNPTCANTGLAYALHLGFKTVYLLGVDLGMKDTEKHHASSSQYYASEEKDKPNFASSEKRVNIRVPGNFGGEIQTTATLDTARANMVLAIRYNPQARVYNANDGAAIEGAEAMEAQSIEIPPCEHKQELLEKIESECFSHRGGEAEINEKRARNKYLVEFFRFRETLQLPPQMDDTVAVQDALDNIHLSILDLKKQSPVAYWLLCGSLQTFSTLLLRSCLLADTAHEFRENYAYCLAIYNEFLRRAFALMRQNCLQEHNISADYSDLDPDDANSDTNTNDFTEST